MVSLKLFTKLILYVIFIGVIFAGSMGLYEVIKNFGNGTMVIVVPSAFIILMGVFGMISTYNNIK